MLPTKYILKYMKSIKAKTSFGVCCAWGQFIFSIYINQAAVNLNSKIPFRFHCQPQYLAPPTQHTIQMLITLKIAHINYINYNCFAPKINSQRICAKPITNPDQIMPKVKTLHVDIWHLVLLAEQIFTTFVLHYEYYLNCTYYFS